MNGRRKPRVPRPTSAFLLQKALLRASRFTQPEVQRLMEPVHAALAALRQGVATEHQWVQLASAAAISQSVEHKGVVRGMAEHLQAADQALEGIHRRAMASGAWQPTALYFQELDAVTLLVELHEFQIRNLSAGEFHAAFDHAVADMVRVGGRLVHVGREAQQLERSLSEGMSA